MPKTTPFERHVDRYEAWFEEHAAAYEAELRAVRAFWPEGADGLEVGAGAGHFAAPLGIKTAVEPAAAMRDAAARRGLRSVNGVAECLPFDDGRFDAALMVTTICFVDDPARAVCELYRVLRPGGCAVIGFVDRESVLGRSYERKRAASAFYGEARFFDVREVRDLLTDAGFAQIESCQTLFPGSGDKREPDRVEPGSGKGAFVVLRGWKPPRTEKTSSEP